jgi:hypothetical protein
MLSGILSNNESSLDETLNAIYRLEDDAQANVDNPELPFIFCMTRLAKHSLEYWNSSKGEVWLDKINEIASSVGQNSIAARPHVNWKVVATADVIGFLAGAPAGFNTGAVIGGLALGIETGGLAAGVGATLGGLAGATVTGLTGAIGASGHALALELIANWW